MHHFVHFSISYLGNVYYMDVINAQKLLFNYVPFAILPIILFMLVNLYLLLLATLNLSTFHVIVFLLGLNNYAN